MSDEEPNEPSNRVVVTLGRLTTANPHLIGVAWHAAGLAGATREERQKALGQNPHARGMVTVGHELYNIAEDTGPGTIQGRDTVPAHMTGGQYASFCKATDERTIVKGVPGNSGVAVWLSGPVRPTQMTAWRPLSETPLTGNLSSGVRIAPDKTRCRWQVENTSPNTLIVITRWAKVAGWYAWPLQRKEGELCTVFEQPQHYDDFEVPRPKRQTFERDGTDGESEPWP